MHLSLLFIFVLLCLLSCLLLLGDNGTNGVELFLIKHLNFISCANDTNFKVLAVLNNFKKSLDRESYGLFVIHTLFPLFLKELS